MTILSMIFQTGYTFLRVVNAAILIYCVLSWFQPTFKAFYILKTMVEPFLIPFRRLAMKARDHFRVPVDFTCLFAVIGYDILMRLWMGLFALLVRARL